MQILFSSERTPTAASTHTLRSRKQRGGSGGYANAACDAYSSTVHTRPIPSVFATVDAQCSLCSTQVQVANPLPRFRCVCQINWFWTPIPPVTATPVPKRFSDQGNSGPILRPEPAEYGQLSSEAKLRFFCALLGLPSDLFAAE